MINEINNRARFEETQELLAAMRTSDVNYGVGLLVLSAWVGGMSFVYETNIEMHTGNQYLEALAVYFSRVNR